MKKQSAINIELATCLQGVLDRQQQTEIRWNCDNCGEIHSGNLLKKVHTIKTGHLVGDRQPDLAFFDENGGLFAVLHFVKRKTIDPALNEFYKGKCICLQVKLEPDDEFSTLFEKLHTPASVTTCFNPKCPTCNEHMQKIKLWIVDSECWKCHGEMKVAAIEAGMTRYATYVGPDQFTENEKAMARSKGVIIAEHYSKTVQEKYLANTCPHCHTFIGNHFLFTEHIAEASYGYLPYEIIVMGYCCDTCDAPDETEELK